jgi:transcriptional regulator with XRE-family HTH domain
MAEPFNPGPAPAPDPHLEPVPMTQDEKMFFKAVGIRIANARNAIPMTQVQLAEAMGVSQQTIASWEVGRRGVAIAALPLLARTLALSVEALVGVPTPLGQGKRGPQPRLLQQVERIQRLPRPQQRFVMQMIDTALQASATQAAE